MKQGQVQTVVYMTDLSKAILCVQCEDSPLIDQC